MQLPKRTYLVREGTEVLIDLCGEPLAALDVHFILGSCLGVLLIQRGMLVLHASVVATDVGALAFLGNSGRGKSTLAAALHKRGHRVLADDHCALVEGDEPQVVPAYPALKLAPENLVRFHLRPVAGMPPSDDPDFKVFASCREGYSEEPVAIKAFFVLGGHTGEPDVQLLPKPVAALRLLENVFAPRVAGQKDQGASHFARTADLAMQVPVFSVGQQLGLDRLDERIEAIEAAVRNLPART